MQKGIVSWVDPEGQRGMVRVQGGHDLPFDAADSPGRARVRPGDHVAFDVMQTPAGPVALNLIRKP
ncbi:hypothetical protein [Alicyclobacillus vulcanalis]|uniref:Cold shock protein (Beta-ribbon, CspA family) n=1 Tax=Alicyclobacillus vulcanalis TaxID=252246 RepID=A0A1N7JMI1_9BACL|nr:hypothetical protein [Alicyclobacillus vulcanalis]SIS50510.1 cold shock protein (beta-ribbon, CspA family) [Alicyclobacillus vulcanalis]